MDTIFALSTATGKAGVAVIRVSGPEAIAALSRLNSEIPQPHKAAVRVLRGSDGVRLDEALILIFPKGHSFTGEESVEIQCHGSPAVIDAIMRALAEINGLRLADAGEFTRRALENNRLDVAQVEGLADLLDAETEAQRRQALRVFSGDLGKKAEQWRKNLIRAAALIEATIDFADEEVPTDVSPEVVDLIDETQAMLKKEIAGAAVAERVRSGFEVAIVGPPNVGKSTLLNILAGREAAITSEYAGTTRDVIEVRMDIAGLPVTFLDTAGLRETDDHVENIGIDRARARAEKADVRVFLVSDNAPPVLDIKKDDLVLRSKGDLLDSDKGTISGKTGQGVPELLAHLSEVLSQRTSEIGIATRLRHQQAMERSSTALDQARQLIPMGENLAEVTAEELHTAIRALDSLIGRVDVENVLDEIFSSFCLGK